MNISNKQLKYKIKDLILDLLGEYDPNHVKPKISINVMTTNKTNTFPAYNSNLGNKFVNISMNKKFICSMYMNKAEIKHFTEKQFLSFIGHQFIKGYKEFIISNISE